MAFLTLFRVATGDNWNGIMKVCSMAEVDYHIDTLGGCTFFPFIQFIT